MLKVRSNAPRHLRSHLARMIELDSKLYLLSPAQCGGKAWRYAVAYHGAFVLIGKPVGSREEGRVDSLRRWGAKASEYRRKARATIAA